MKRAIRKILRSLGYDVVKLQEPEQAKKSVRSKNLSYHQTATGNYFLPTDAIKDLILNAIKNDQIFDLAIYEVAKKHIRPNTTVLDVGSNFGQMAILFSKLVGEKGVVHAFDADDFIFEILQKNIKENSKNVIAHFGAVHDKSNETLFFPLQDFEKFDTYGSFGIDYVNGKGRPVPTLRIDDLDFEFPVSFMKVDVQGGDLFAMKGAVETIKKYQMPIVFEYEYSFEEELDLSFQEYVDFVRDINYKFASVIDGQNFLILPDQK